MHRAPVTVGVLLCCFLSPAAAAPPVAAPQAVADDAATEPQAVANDDTAAEPQAPIDWSDPGLRKPPPPRAPRQRSVRVAPCTTEALAEAAASAAKAAAEASERTAATLQSLLEQQAIAAGFVPVTMPEESPWSYNLGLTALSISGNASSYSIKGDAGVEGHWRQWNVEAKLSSAYGQASPQAGPLQVTASRGEAFVRGQRNYNPVLGTYLLTGGMFDRVSSIAWQTYGEGGLSLLWWEQKQAGYLRSRLRTSLGARYTREHRQQFFPPAILADAYRNIYSPTVTGNFRFGLSRNAYFFEDAEILQNAQVSQDLRIVSTTGLSAQVNQRVTLTLSYKVRYLGNNAAVQRKTTDTELAAGLTWSS